MGCTARALYVHSTLCDTHRADEHVPHAPSHRCIARRPSRSQLRRVQPALCVCCRRRCPPAAQLSRLSTDWRAFLSRTTDQRIALVHDLPSSQLTTVTTPATLASPPLRSALLCRARCAVAPPSVDRAAAVGAHTQADGADAARRRARSRQQLCAAAAHRRAASAAAARRRRSRHGCATPPTPPPARPPAPLPPARAGIRRVRFAAASAVRRACSRV
jgi:hypothetical protein